MGESNPSFLPWKGSVLTDRRIEHGGSFLQELPNLLAWEVCRRVATSSAMLAPCVWIHTRLIEDFWINYYTSTNLARQELFCNLLVIFQLATSEIRSSDLSVLHSVHLCWHRSLVVPLFLSGHQVVFVFSFHRWILHQPWIYDNTSFNNLTI